MNYGGYTIQSKTSMVFSELELNIFWLFIYIFVCVGSQLLPSLFSSCSDWGLLYICSVWAFHCDGFSCCECLSQALDVQISVAAAREQLWRFRTQAQQLWHTSLVVPWHVGSSKIKDLTPDPCIGRRILYHWATRGAHIKNSWRYFGVQNVLPHSFLLFSLLFSPRPLQTLV